MTMQSLTMGYRTTVIGMSNLQVVDGSIVEPLAVNVQFDNMAGKNLDWGTSFRPL